MLFKAHAYEIFGTVRDGKTHKVDDERLGRSFCGKTLAEMPGIEVDEGLNAITCKGCLSAIESRKRYVQYQASVEERELERQREQEEWNAWYSDYLLSPEWRNRRALVIRRAGGMCEGCFERKATQVHHKTYKRVGQEMLFDLVAVCTECHALIHKDQNELEENHENKYLTPGTY